MLAKKMETWNLITLKPSGRVGALDQHADGTCHRVEVPTWTPTEEGKKLREARRASRLSLGDAAARAGLLVAQFSGLEHGRYSLPADEWVRLMALIGGAS